jgi:O-antigen ligase
MSSFMIKIKQHLGASHDYLSALLILSLPFFNSIPNILMGALLLLYLIDFKKDILTQYFKSPFMVLTVLVCFIFTQALWNHSFLTDFTYYKKYLYLIILPILFFKVGNLNLIKNTTLVSAALTILMSLYKIYKFYHAFGYFPFSNGWATNFVLVIERPYAGLYSLMAIVISFDLFLNNRKKIYLVSLCFFLGFIFAISIRTSVLTFFLLVLLYITFYLKIDIKRKSILFISLLMLGALLLVTNKNISKRFFIKDSISKTIQTTQEFEPRVIIYHCVKEIIQEQDFSVFTGVDSYNSLQKKLDSCYSESIVDYYKRAWFLEQQFNTHSQFVDMFLIGGIAAVLLLVLFFILLFRCCYKDFPATAIMISLLMMLLIENVFHRQFGCFVFAIFATLYFRSAKTNKTI